MGPNAGDLVVMAALETDTSTQRNGQQEMRHVRVHLLHDWVGHNISEQVIEHLRSPFSDLGTAPLLARAQRQCAKFTGENGAKSAGDLIAWIESHDRHSRESQVMAFSPGDVDDLELFGGEVVTSFSLEVKRVYV